MIHRHVGPVTALATLFCCLAAPYATAATVDTAGEVGIVADLQFGIGDPPLLLDIQLGALTDLTQATDSHVDDPAAVQSGDTASQIGSIYSDPPLPYYQTEFHQTDLAGNGTARGFELTEAAILPDSDNQRPARLDRTMVGQTSLTFSDLTVDAGAEASSAIGRSMILSNPNNIFVPLTVTANLSMSVSASADAVNAMSSAQAIFNLFWVTTGDVTFFQTLLQTLDETLDDGDPGTVVDASVIPGNALFDGFRVEATATATGTGAPTEASYQITQRMTYDINMGPQSTLLFNFFQSQDLDSTYIAPDPMTPVPLPAPALALLSGLGALAALRRRWRG